MLTALRPQVVHAPTQAAEQRVRLFCFLALALTTGFWLIYIWFFSDAAWLHPELLGTAAYIWNFPDQDSMGALLRKVFDWKAFDPNVNRVRPLNDLAEVIDAVARPYLARSFGPHPSAMPSALLTLALAPALFFPWLRRTLGSALPALCLCMLFVSSTGFLSDIVAYIRPAKKLNLLFLCLSLFLAQRFADQHRGRTFTALYACLLASFFADELGLANFVIIGVMHWKDLFVTAARRYRWWFLSLPLAFLLITKFAIPAAYSAWSVHGAWDALADPKKFAVFAYLLQPAFYLASLEALARSLLSTVAIGVHTPLTESLTLLVFFVFVPAIHILRVRLRSWRAILADRLVLATIALAGVSTYATLLDWYPFPYKVSYLGSFNYYYHSSVVVSVIMWLACAAKVLLLDPFARWPGPRLPIIAAASLVSCLWLTANFILFERVNVLVQIIHLYPYNNRDLWSSLRDTRARSINQGNSALVVHLIGDSDQEARRYKAALQALFGERWTGNFFYRVMGSIAPNPIMSPAHVAHFYQATLPWTKVSLSIEQRGRQGWVLPLRSTALPFSSSLSPNSLARVAPRTGLALPRGTQAELAPEMAQGRQQPDHGSN